MTALYLKHDIPVNLWELLGGRSPPYLTLYYIKNSKTSIPETVTVFYQVIQLFFVAEDDTIALGIRKGT
jgi:hypothetical protein